MQITAEPIIYGLIFVGVLALVEGLYLVAFGKSISLNSRVNRRLEMLDKGTGREKVLEQLRKEMQQHMKSRSIPLYSLLADRELMLAVLTLSLIFTVIISAVSLYRVFNEDLAHLHVELKQVESSYLSSFSASLWV